MGRLALDFCQFDPGSLRRMFVPGVRRMGEGSEPLFACMYCDLWFVKVDNLWFLKVADLWFLEARLSNREPVRSTVRQILLRRKTNEVLTATTSPRHLFCSFLCSGYE